MKIGELAKRTGCQAPTIRYYEQEGLLYAAERTKKNYRLYTEEHVERLQFIRHCREHQISLEEIKKLLAYRDNPDQDCTWITELISKHLAAVDRQIASLRRLQSYLETLQRKCAGGKHIGSCGIMRSLEDSSLCPCTQQEKNTP